MPNKKTKPACLNAQGHTGIPMLIYIYLSSYKRMRKYYFNPIIQKHMQFNEKTVPEGSVDHFREVTKMVTLGSGATREVQDYMLTRYACYQRHMRSISAKEVSLN